jgi:hypothetical protein
LLDSTTRRHLDGFDAARGLAEHGVAWNENGAPGDDRRLGPVVVLPETDEEQTAAHNAPGHPRSSILTSAPQTREGTTPRVRDYSTVTDFARLRGMSTSQPRMTAM